MQRNMEKMEKENNIRIEVEEQKVQEIMKSAPKKKKVKKLYKKNTLKFLISLYYPEKQAPRPTNVPRRTKKIRKKTKRPKILRPPLQTKKHIQNGPPLRGHPRSPPFLHPLLPKLLRRGRKNLHSKKQPKIRNQSQKLHAHFQRKKFRRLNENLLFYSLVSRALCRRRRKRHQFRT